MSPVVFWVIIITIAVVWFSTCAVSYIAGHYAGSASQRAEHAKLDLESVFAHVRWLHANQRPTEPPPPPPPPVTST